MFEKYLRIRLNNLMKRNKERSKPTDSAPERSLLGYRRSGFFFPMRYYALGVVIVAFFAKIYMAVQTRRLKAAVYKKIVRGSRPDVINSSVMIPRKDNEMLAWFIKNNNESYDYDDKKFGLIVGPTGTGKTTMVRNLCNKFPQGILYYEVTVPTMFTEGVAKELGMKIAPSNIMDVILGYFSTTYTMYYSLEPDQEKALNTIVETFKRAAKKYRTKYKKVPTLFIDGSDLLAKTQEALFVHLLIQAKLLANEGIATIVLVSSEGSILPIIQQHSEVSRCSKVFEITDIKDEDAIQYLIKRGFSRQLGERFVQYAGGRCIYLLNGGNLHNFYTALYPYIKDHELYNKIIDDIFMLKISNQRTTLQKNEPYTTKIIDLLSTQGGFHPSDLMKMCSGDSSKLDDAMAELICANILRYTYKGLLEWHGRPQEFEFKRQ